MPNKDTKKVIVPRQSVHVVFFSCPNCGEEAEHIHTCSDCGSSMRVIDVVEKFGEEAEEFRKKIKEKAANGTLKEEDLDTEKDEETPNIIVLGDADHIEDDGAIEDDDTAQLGDIFPDDEENPTSSAPEGLTDLDDIVAELDKEEDDDFSLGSLDDLGEDGLPEL